MPEDKKTGNPLIDREYVENYKLTIEAPQSSVERYYFWILNFLKSNKPFGMGLNVEKIKDYFSMTETSAYFGATEQKKAIQQDRAAQFLRGISEMTKGLYQQVRELRIIKERMQYYKDAEEGSEAAEIALKGLWANVVEGGAKNPDSVYGLQTQLGFAILPDLFFSVHPGKEEEIEKFIKRMDEDKGLDLNRKQREVLKRKLYQFMQWKVHTHKELIQRNKFSLKYLRQHYNTMKLYMNWIRPYLRSAKRLEAKGQITAPELVSAFDTTLIELELLGYNNKYKEYFPCVVVKYKYTAIPQMAYQEEYQRGAIHTGKTELSFEAYVLKKEEIEEYKKKIDEEDFELLSSIDETMTSLGDELKEFLKEAGEKFDKEEKKEEKDERNFLAKMFFPKKKKEEEKEEEHATIFEPFIALVEGFGELISFLKIKKAKEKEPKVGEKEKAKDEAKKTLAVVYTVMKKAHGMLAW
ncbi:MAG TPA: hypothetical protein VJ000_02675 [Thermodesulfovibrionia bacterium]|nr:hypothetical protein [Candidatus Woesearchaeota archaeon]HLA50078.1 hypothetical protein [Thermodesulfovibrionia bacterium]